MDYEKKYKDLLERARKLRDKNCDGCKMCMESLFDGLAESEDERISREITEFILTHRIDEPNDIEDTNTWLAWLEKQGEKPKKVSIWKHWKDGIAGNAEGEQVFLQKIGRNYCISSCLGCECDYIELSELDKLMREENQSPNPKWDDELLMVITWFSRIKQLATDMTTWNNHVVKNAKECLYEITLVAKEALEYLNKQGE